MRRLGIALFCTVALLLVSAGGAGAQTAAEGRPGRSVEVFGGLTVSSAHPDGSVPSSFSPPFLFGASSASSAEQLLTIAGNHGTAFEVGANLFLDRHVGLQVRFERSRTDIGGANAPYVAHLRYISVPPPSYTPVSNSYDVSYTWPDTTGEWRTSSLSLNPVFRGSLGRRVMGTVSGGLSYLRLSGAVAPVALSQYWLGGHSVLFSSLYRLRAEAAPVNSVGLNVGGGVSVAVSSRFSVLADVRWVYAGHVEVPLTVTEVLNPSEITMAQDLDFIRSAMAPAPGPASIDTSRVRVTVGAQIRLFAAQEK